MKKRLLTFVALALVMTSAKASVEINPTNFPDATFREAIMEWANTDGDNTLSDDELAAAVEAFREMITRTTLALSLERGDAPEGAVSREWDINGKKAVLGVQKNA